MPRKKRRPSTPNQTPDTSFPQSETLPITVGLTFADDGTLRPLVTIYNVTSTGMSPEAARDVAQKLMGNAAIAELVSAASLRQRAQVQLMAETMGEQLERISGGLTVDAYTDQMSASLLELLRGAYNEIRL